MLFPGDVLGRPFDLQERIEAQRSLPRSVKMMMGAEEEKEYLIRCNWGHRISLKLWYLPYLIIVSHQWRNKSPEQTRLIVYNYSSWFLVLFLPGSMHLPTLSLENSPALKKIPVFLVDKLVWWLPLHSCFPPFPILLSFLGLCNQIALHAEVLPIKIRTKSSILPLHVLALTKHFNFIKIFKFNKFNFNKNCTFIFILFAFQL